MTDQGRLADPLGDRKCFVKRAVEYQPGGARFCCPRVCVLELSEDLRFTHDHRIKARTDAKEVAYRAAGFIAIERGAEHCCINAAVARQKSRSLFVGIFAAAGHTHYLDAITSRNQC